MPPKRREIADLSDAPESKRRVTRSATIAKGTSRKEDEKKPARSSAKAPSKTAKKSTSATKKADKPGRAITPTSRAANEPTTLTIESDSVKNPVICHEYTPASSNKSKAPTQIFTHGAGGTLSAPAVVNFCRGYSSTAPVLAFQGSMNLKARVKGFHAVISRLYSDDNEISTLVLGGRSMGARAAVIAGTELLAEGSHSKTSLSIILISYPLKGPKDDIRDQILFDLPSTVQILFVIGEKDAMCPLELLNTTRKKMSASSQLVVVKGADHGMHLRPADLERQSGEESGRIAAQWVNGELEEEESYIGDKE